MTVDFFQHNDCLGNELQRKVLSDAGFSLNIYSIFDIRWKAEHLYLFFKDTPVYTWFDYGADSIKSNFFDPKTVSPEEALQFMLQDMKLIKRPLIHFNGEYCAGFDTELVKRLLAFTKTISPDVIKNGGLCANYKNWRSIEEE